MTKWEKEKCPVCGKYVGVSPTAGTLRPHTDKVGRRCGMGGQAVT